MVTTDFKPVAGLPIARQSFCDIHLLAASHPLIKMSYMQTSRGRFRGEMLALSLPAGGLFWRSRANLGGTGQGEIAEGYRLVAMAGYQTVEHWHGQEFLGDRLATGNGSIELQHRTHNHHEALCWMVKQSRVDQIAYDLGLDARRLDPAAPWLKLPSGQIDHYRDTIRDFLCCIEGRDQVAEGEALCFEEFLVASLLRGLPPSRPARLSIASLAVARQVRDRLHGMLNEPLHVSGLCRVLSIHERTLHRQFSSTFGMSPRTYHQCLRLQAVRLKLLNPVEATAGVISRTASHHGFWHMGRFCRQYRLLFGETPTDTLRRARDVPWSRLWPGWQSA